MTIKASNFPTTRPSLDLNFAQTKRLDPRVTFSRNSSATYFDSDGLLKSAATNVPRFDHNPTTGESLGLLVEEARTNSLTYGETFSDTVWTKTNTIVLPNALSSPSGLFTASKLIETAANSTHSLDRNITLSPGTGSIFLKAAERTRVRIYISGVIENSFDIDLSLGTITRVGSSVSQIPTITALKDSWYRVTWPTGYRQINILDNTGAVSYAGDGISGVYIWGAQLENGSFPTSYIPTPATFTSRASSATYYDANGVIQTASTNVARSNAFFPDSNGVMRPAGLLLEPAGTNLVTYSQEFDNAAWRKTSSTITANAAAGPDGTTTADLLYPSSTGSLRYMDASASISSSITTMSFFVKASGFTRCYLVGGTTSIAAWFDLSTNTVGTVTSGCTASIQRLGSGWFRCSLTQPATTTPYASIGPCDADNSFVATASGTNGILIWGAQLEASPYPTSYIQTVASTVTRSADVSSSATVTRSADVAQITGSNFSSWYNASQGTLLGSGTPNSTSIANQFLGCLSDNTDANFIGIARSYANNVTDAGFGVVSSNSTQAALSVVAGSWAASQRRSLIGAYATNNFAFSFNGGTIGADTSGSVPTVSQLRIGGATGPTPAPFNGTISRLTYWPTRLSNATLQAITR